MCDVIGCLSGKFVKSIQFVLQVGAQYVLVCHVAVEASSVEALYNFGRSQVVKTLTGVYFDESFYLKH